MAMKWISIFCFSVCMSTSSYAQMIKAPTNTKPLENKNKPVSKPVVRFNDDDDKDPAAKPADNSYAYLVIRSNRGSGITVNINDSTAGKIKASMSKKIPISNADELRISLNDGQGNQFDTSFVVDDTHAGKNIMVAFPEVDYAAARAEEARLKKERDDQIRLAKEEEARKIKEAEDEALRKLREAEEALKQQRIGLLTDAETGIREVITKSLASKTLLQQHIDQIKKGELSITEDVTKNLADFITGKTTLLDNLKTYTDSATAYNMKEKRDNFLKETKADHDKIVKDEFYNFIPSVLAGKIPMSKDVATAFKASRAQDIPFFIAKDTLDDANIGGKRLLYYALEAKSNATVFKYLFENGVTPNNFGFRFPENKDVYATPIAYACINGDLEVIRLFAEKEAAFFPASMSRIDKKNQVKYLLTRFGNKPEILALLKEYKYDMDDGTAAILAAIGAVDSSMVLIEGGSFTMGCTAQLAADCSSDEKPAIGVTVDGFYMSKFEVTQKIWAAIMDDENPSFFKDCPTCPVEMVSWEMVDKFIQRLNKFSGKTFRLPTEAEWEFAARGGKAEDNTFMYSGSKDANEVAWYKDNSNKTSPVGSKKPNALGLHDMSGSVSEWCNDFYASDYFSRSTLNNPKGPDVSAQKVVRGGSFMQSSWSSRVSNREGHEDFFTNNNTGFRLAMSK